MERQTALTRRLIAEGCAPRVILDEALARSRSLTRLLTKAESEEDGEERRKLVSEALRKSCELRDALDEAERAA